MRSYFKNTYNDKWITDELSARMIKSVDHSEVIDKNTIKSPLFGLISPVGLSGGVKTLILIANDSKHVFNASNYGDNCAKWILEIAKQKDFFVVINIVFFNFVPELNIDILNTFLLQISIYVFFTKRKYTMQKGIHSIERKICSMLSKKCFQMVFA